MIRQLNPEDHKNWLELAREVEPLFGPMTDSEEFKLGIMECINGNNAFGIENQAGELAGIVALDRAKNEILWLAVGKKYRGLKYGDMLVKRAVKELEQNGDVFVQTFADNIPEGKPARVIYEKNGFSDLKDGGLNPAGIDTKIMVKKTI